MSSSPFSALCLWSPPVVVFIKVGHNFSVDNQTYCPCILGAVEEVDLANEGDRPKLVPRPTTPLIFLALAELSPAHHSNAALLTMCRL